MRIIPFPIHRVIDFFLGFALIIIPWTVEGWHEGFPAYFTFFSGLALLLISIFTEGALSKWRKLSVRLHLWLDSVLGMGLVLLPLFFRQGIHAFFAHIVTGGLLILLAIITENGLPTQFKYYH